MLPLDSAVIAQDLFQFTVLTNHRLALAAAQASDSVPWLHIKVFLLKYPRKPTEMW